MFVRRIKLTRLQKLREALWPSMGLYRLGCYYRNRVGRLKESPYAIAAGFATGVAVSFTPFLGFHLAFGGLMALALRGSLVAMVVGTVLTGNPWTFPFIWVTTYRLGRWFLGGAAHVDRIPDTFTIADLLQRPAELLYPMTLGCVPFFIVSWIVAFYVVRHLVTGYKETRMARIGKNKKN